MAKSEANISWLKGSVTPTIDEIHKDGYFDIMNEQRGSLDFQFMTKFRKNVPVYKHNVQRTNEQICGHVLKSDRVRYTINKLKSNILSESELNKQAKEILEEMGHRLNLKGVRFFAFILIKIFKQLFKHVYVNEDAVKQLHSLLMEYPVLLMPTHRSYFDFLLVSYVFFHYDMPLPAIAAAMDFKGMKFFGWLLQLCGAFYIRRSFGSDILYWAIFTEYVQTQLRNSDYPLQFFIEGTRSRTNKSYFPKTGMLSASLESYFKAELPDIMVIPITVSYDRIVEENLYSYELLGIPKPKESTSGLLKARNVLTKIFGSVHIHFSTAISIREYSNYRIDRIAHSLQPRYINNLNSNEMQLLSEFALHIVKRQQEHIVITPWSLIATVLVQNMQGIQLHEMLIQVDWLRQQAHHMGAYIDWPSNLNTTDIIKKCSSTRDDIIVFENCISVAMDAEADVMKNAATHLTLASYRNQLMHVFANLAFISLAIQTANSRHTLSMGDLFFNYTKLQKILSKDFIFEEKNVDQTFYYSVITLRNNGIICVEPNIPDGIISFFQDISNLNICVNKSTNKYVTFYCKMFEPFLLTYWFTCRHLLMLSTDSTGQILPRKLKDLALDIQNSILKIIQSKSIKNYEILSLDIITNALKSFIELQIISSEKRNQELWLSAKYLEIIKMSHYIESLIEIPSVLDNVSIDQKPLNLYSKL